MTDRDQPPSPPEWPGPARALVDLFPGEDTTALEMLWTMRHVVPLHGVNVLSLGPPLRVQVPLSALVDIVDAVAYDRVRILQWPFSLPPPDRRSGR